MTKYLVVTNNKPAYVFNDKHDAEAFLNRMNEITGTYDFSLITVEEGGNLEASTVYADYIGDKLNKVDSVLDRVDMLIKFTDNEKAVKAAKMLDDALEELYTLEENMRSGREIKTFSAYQDWLADVNDYQFRIRKAIKKVQKALN